MANKQEQETILASTVKTSDSKPERRKAEPSVKVLDSSLGAILEHVMQTNKLLMDLTREVEDVKREVTIVKKEVSDVRKELIDHMNHEEEEQKKYIEAIEKLTIDLQDVANLKYAFVEIDGKLDVHGHRDFHKGEIDDHKSWSDLKQEAKKKIMDHAITGLIMILGLGLFTWFNQMQHQAAGNVQPQMNAEQVKAMTETIRDTLVNPPLDKNGLYLKQPHELVEKKK
jgi:hypothetical protein